MQTDPNTTNGHHLQEKLHDSLESGKQTAVSCCESLRSSSSQLCDATCEGIRKNPIASVIGAAFVGAAVCYLILEGRSQPSFNDRYVSGPLSNASDSISDSLGSLYDSLKFW